MTAAWLVPVSDTWLTFDVARLASEPPCCALMTEAKTWPFCSRVRRLASGVLALKNVAQFDSIAETAPAPEVGSPDGDDEVGGREVGGLDDVLLLLLHAPSASPSALSATTAARLDLRKHRLGIATVCRTGQWPAQQARATGLRISWGR